MATINGTSGDDFITGTGNADTISTDGGDDQVNAGTGADTVYGGSGNDRINGNGGDDKIVGGAGVDLLWGGSGNDTFVVGGGSGDDQIMDWQNGVDKIKINSSGVNGFGDLEIDEAAFNGQEGVRIRWGTGEEVFIYGAEQGDMNAGDFIF